MTATAARVGTATPVVAARMRRLRAVRGPAGVAAGALAAVVVVAVVDPNEPGHYPTCPFLAVTGLFCPGCGSLRAVHALARGDVALAVSLNVLTVLAVLPLVLGWAAWLRRSLRGAQRTSVLPAPAIWALLVVVCGFAVLRNLPIGAALAP